MTATELQTLNEDLGRPLLIPALRPWEPLHWLDQAADLPHRFVNAARLRENMRGMNFCVVPGCKRTIAQHADWLDS